MENRHPSPEDTEDSTSKDSSPASKAESVIAWIGRQREEEHHMLFAMRAEKHSKKEKDDDEEDDDDDDLSFAKSHHLKLGGFTIQKGGEEQPPVVPDELPEEPRLESEIIENAEDFEQWEQEIATANAEVSSADMQMAEPDVLVDVPIEKSRQDVRIDEPQEQEQPEAQIQKVDDKHSSNHHQGRENSARAAHVEHSLSAQPDTQKPSAAAGGGGGEVPPTDHVEGAADMPDEPFENNQNTVLNTRSTLMERFHLDALQGSRPNTITDHEHRHTHVGMGILMAAGLLAERISGKRADRRIEKASRKRDDKLREQIEDTRIVQEQTRQKLESRQRQLSEAQERQRLTLEQVRPTVNNIERTVASSHVERPEVIQKQVEAVSAPLAAELHQHIEQSAMPSANVETKLQPKIVMEQIAAAAEHNEPVERVYERRQEVKDEPGTPAGAAAGGAATIGSLIAKQYSAQQQAGQTTQRAAAPKPGSSPSSQGHTVDYRAAAIRGVGAGLAVIVLALLAYVLL